MLSVLSSPRGAGTRPAHIPQFVPVKGYNFNPAIVAAKFPVEGGNAGRMAYGAVYRDGSCSCTEFSRRGCCQHTEAWDAMVEAVGQQYLRHGYDHYSLRTWASHEYGLDPDIAGTIADEAVSILYDNAYGDIESYR